MPQQTPSHRVLLGWYQIMLNELAISFRTPPGIRIVLVLILMLVLQRCAEHHVLTHRRVPNTGYQQRLHVKRQAEKLVPRCASKGRASVFFVLSSGSLGSLRLMNELRQHKQVFVPPSIPIDAVNGSFFGEIRDSQRREDGRAIGYVVKPRALSMNMQLWKAIISDKRLVVRFIVNYPYNLFKEALHDWVLENSSLVNSKAFHYRLSQLWHGEKELVQALSRLDMDPCVLPLSYETMQRSPLKTQFAVQAFIGIPVNMSSLDSIQISTTSTTMCELVSNWDDACRDFFSCDIWQPMMTTTRTVHVRKCKADRRGHFATYCETMIQPIKKVKI